MAAVTPVRPPRPALEAMVKAFALPGVASVRFRAAVRATGSPEAAFRHLARRVWPRLAERERDRVAGWARAALRSIDALDAHVLTEEMSEYPAAFRDLTDPPYLVFARGRVELLATPMVAIVGTRRSTEAGREVAGRIARGIAASGVTVISGLARGIDGAAHRAAGPARTVGVLGCGVDVHYPLEHRELQDRIARDGLILTELLPGAPPEGHNFPRRNRLIAALATGVVVVDAPARSGALLTSNQALDLGRPVFAVPGPVVGGMSAGSNRLIQDGARLVTDAREVLFALGLPLPPAGSDGDEEPPAELEGVGLALWRALGAGARHADALADEVGLPIHHGLASLLALEVQGHIRQLPGMRFTRP